MGIAITDNGFRAKCFEIDGNKILQEIVAEMQQKDENRDIRANEVRGTNYANYLHSVLFCSTLAS